MMKTAAQQMLRTCNKLFARKTPNEMLEAHPSNLETAAHLENVQQLPGSPSPDPSPAPSPPPEALQECAHHVVAMMERAHHGGGWLLSGLICMNILFIGCSMVSGNAISGIVTAEQLQIYIIVLLLLTMLWMLFYATVTSRKDQALFTDSHAGPVWLRVGLVLFGLLSLLMDSFKIVNYVGYLHCESAVKVAFPVVQAVFLFAQTYFLWVHAKDCVQIHTNLTRCGLTLTLSTNLVVWMAAVTEESLHQTVLPDFNTSISHKMYRASFGDDKCKCSHSMCDTFKEAFYYLYPFNIEYSLFASTIAYVMWKNVGRIVEDHHHGQHAKFRPRDVCLGPVTGILLVLAGLVTFILYEVGILEEDKGKRTEALVIHFISNIAIVSLMSVAAAIGCLVYRLDRREHVSEKNPTRTLDMALLVGASMGQLIISYFSIVAMVATGATGRLNSLNLAWAVLMVLELGLQNYFIIEGLHREPFHVMQEAALHTNAHNFHEHVELKVVMQGHKHNYFLGPSDNKPNWKRRILKEVCAFLLLANIILWIMPAFGARPQFDHPVEIKLYKFASWAAIVNVGLPFGIFYRMHSVASLFEVYLIS